MKIERNIWKQKTKNPFLFYKLPLQYNINYIKTWEYNISYLFIISTIIYKLYKNIICFILSNFNILNTFKYME